MIKIIETNVRGGGDLVTWELDNGDEVVLTWEELDALHEGKIEEVTTIHAEEVLSVFYADEGIEDGIYEVDYLEKGN